MTGVHTPLTYLLNTLGHMIPTTTVTTGRTKSRIIVTKVTIVFIMFIIIYFLSFRD